MNKTKQLKESIHIHNFMYGIKFKRRITMERNVNLLNEDFKDFEIGEFPYDRNHSAMGEYNYVSNEGYYGKWHDPVVNHTYNGKGASWIVTECDGVNYMEQMRLHNTKPHITHQMLTTGSIFWRDYTVECTLRMFNTKWGNAGLGFVCQNSMNLLVLLFEDQKLKLVYRHKEEITILKEMDFTYDSDHYYILKAVCDGNHITCYVNGTKQFDVKSDIVRQGGKIAITATIPSQFTSVTVNTDKKTNELINKASEEKEAKALNAQMSVPKMQLWKRIDLQNFGTGRQIRFGHLTGNDEWYIVMAQSQKRVERDSYGHISCLTAIDLEGNILWQIGIPSNKYDHGKISADMPLQVYDIDGDGIDEVITARNFEIMILDGRTGEVKKKVKTPFSTVKEDGTIIGVPDKEYAFDRINPDGIRIANFSGKDRPTDILIKDRYCRVYALNSDLEVMWHFQSDKNTGHFPYAIDIDGDGHDELLVGYNMIDHDGKKLWTMPISEDHIDEIIAGKFMEGDDNPYFACVAGSEGFIITDFKGNIVKKDAIGHAQRVSAGNYCPDRGGYELCVTNFWGHQGIIYFYDSHANPLWEMENELNGNVLTPVNWLGNGQDYIMLNPDVKKGGLIDGEGIQVVRFPDDGHPMMCCEALDLLGDSRDEIVVWDYKSLYIYTQSDNPVEDTYTPVKYPHYNMSNYRGEYNFRTKEDACR